MKKIFGFSYMSIISPWSVITYRHWKNCTGNSNNGVIILERNCKWIYNNGGIISNIHIIPSHGSHRPGKVLEFDLGPGILK